MTTTPLETRTEAEAENPGAVFLHSIERITDGPETIRRWVAATRDRLGEDSQALAEEAIRSYSNQAALLGGATALPGLLPGVGTALALTAGPVADMVCLLKLEVELGMTLAAIHGFEIERREERQLVLLAAALNTAEQSPDRSCLGSAYEISKDAIWTYTPRRLMKLWATVGTSLLAVAASRGLARAIPVIGIAVGAGMNKALTQRVGRRLHHDFQQRRRYVDAAQSER